MRTLFTILLLLQIAIPPAVTAQEGLGRFYTTPGQRNRLDEARSRLGAEDFSINSVPEMQVEMPEETDTAPIVQDAISVEGLVFRTDGKNTAWINKGSTASGNIETQYTVVDESDISRNEVQISLPDGESRIRLKVGQEYDVYREQVIDLLPDTTGSEPARPSERSPRSR